jgi:MarR family transcriptional regulator, organic hydroperoxide resistance regulator
MQRKTSKSRRARPPVKRSKILGELMASGRNLSRTSLLFRHVIAEKAGIHVTDAECIDFLLEAGAATAGELAKMAGLTTGAMTAAIDRLENAGFVRRARDPGDRWKVIVKPVMEEIGRFIPFYESMARDVSSLYAGYAGAELRLILKHERQMTEIYQKEIAKIQAVPKPAHKKE